MAKKKKKIVIIGGGPGGYVAAARAAQLGAETTLVEKDLIGGTCLNRGCIPTKSFVHSAALWKSLDTMALFGIRVDYHSFNWRTMMRRKDNTVAKLRGGIQTMLRARGVEVIAGEGFLCADGTVDVKSGSETKKLESTSVILANGSRPAMIPLQLPPGCAALTTDDLLSIKRLPSSLAIIGGGVIGAEIASVFATLGVKVQIIEMLPRILFPLDLDLSEFTKQQFLNAGIGIHTGVKIQEISGSAGNLHIGLDDGVKFDAEQILVAVGRRPNSESLVSSGVTLNKKGFVVVDESLKTNIKGVFAIGDLTGKLMLAHVASAQGIIAAENAMGAYRKMEYSAVPSCVFTFPETASVGITEQQAQEEKLDYVVSKCPFTSSGKALAEGSTLGFIKIIAAKSDGKILGMHIAGDNADLMVNEGAAAMKLGATAVSLSRTVHAHPTRSEGIIDACMGILGHSINY